jgi:thioredoxin-related protein
MLVWAILKGPKKIGQKGDDFRKDEIEEYLIQTLYEPNIQNSICDSHILKFYLPKKSMKGKISEEEIAQITDFIMQYTSKKIKQTNHKKLSLDIVNNKNTLLEQAKREHKLLLIKATSKNCYFCKKMDKEVFSDADIQNTIIRNFILVEVDVDNSSLPYGLDKHYKKITPSFFVVDEQKKLISSLSGSWSKSDFMDFLKESTK